MDSKNKLLVVINPISGGSGKEQLAIDINELLKNHQVSFTTYKTTGHDDEVHIEKILDSENIQNVIIAGGDGTIQLVAKAIGEREIALSLIPAGSANGLASNLQLPDSLAEQIEIALGDSYIMMDVISINDHICLHIADLGINATLIKNYDDSTIRGKLGYAIQTIPTLIESDLPYRFSLELNEKKIEAEGVMIAIANANQFGTGAVINPDGKMDDGRFEVLIFKNLGIVNILKTLDKDSHRDPEFVESFSTKEALITCEKPVSFQIDGEFIGEVTHISAVLLPTRLKLMVPKTLEQ
ncbi:MAG: YegS/Rv2252/BmrU family lipid kinase [Gelidibacter sp.]